MKDGVQIPKQAEVHVSTTNFDIDGAKFEMAPLAKNSKIYSNRDYVWLQVPDKFIGGQFTRLSGGVAAQISVTAKKDGMIYFATALSQPGVDVKGWTKTGDTLNYSDGAKTVMTVFGREVKAGDEVKIPQGNWVGSAVLVPAQWSLVLGD